MRNLKRALSLAVASVMLVGMMVVGTGASYQDVASTDNQEAIEVLQAVGVMVGDDNGDFNPDQLVTRNEMAVILSNLMDYRVASYAGTSPFTDVPAWAEPYVAACYTNGLTSGTSATTYGGSQSVTTVEAALMLMKALGYFQYESDFADGWQLATIAQGNKIDLFTGVTSGSREAMTRNEVAQLVLNTLKSGLVEAEKSGQDISINGDGINVSVTGSVSYVYVTSNENYVRAIDSKLSTTNVSGTTVGSSIVQLGEKLYNGNLKLESYEVSGTIDEFGAPASKWTYKSAEIGTYAEEADYVFQGEVKSSALYSAVGKSVTKSTYDWTVYVDGVEGVSGKTNEDAENYAFTRDEVADNNSDTLNGTARGTTLYVYIEDDGDENNVIAVIVNTYAAEVVKVEDGTVTLQDMADGELDFDVDYDVCDEEDIVLYTKAHDKVSADWEIQAILGVAEHVQGEATTVRNADRVTVDGTTYRYSNRFNADNGDKLTVENVDEEVAFYLDLQGHIIMIDDAVESHDYAYVYSVGEASSQYNSKDVDYGAKLILMDGTTVSVILDDDDTDAIIAADKDSSKTDLEKVREALVGALVSYSVDDDDVYSVSEAADYNATTTGDEIVKNGSARVKVGSTSVYADKNTAFLINDKSDDDDDFNAYVGYNNVPTVDGASNTKVLVKTNSNGVATAVVILGSDVTGSANDVVFVIGNPDAKLNGTGTNKYYVYDAVVNGEVTSIQVKASDAADSAYAAIKTIAKDEVGIFFGITENSSGYVTKVTTDLPKDVEINQATSNIPTWTGVKSVSSGGILTFNTANKSVGMASNDDALIVYYDGDDLVVKSRVTTDTNDNAYVVTDDGDIIAIFIRERD